MPVTNVELMVTIKGRKRHIVVDSLGHLLHVIIHPANDSDTKSGCVVLEETVD